MSSALRRLVPVLFVVVASLTACDRQAPDRALSSEPAQQQWQHHVTDYTQGWVGSEMPLRIRFSHPVVDKTRLNQPLDKLVSLEPHHAVIAVFTSDNVLEIRHPEPFAAGQTYRVQLAPATLQNLPVDLPPFSYSFRVLQQEMSVRETGLVAAGEGDAMQLGGVIETGDSAQAQAVEKILSAQQHGKPLPVRWQHADARTHLFTVEGITRGDTASTLQLRWDGMPIGVDRRGERSVPIPAARAFELLSARAVTQPDTSIEVRFSQPLDARQNPAGLVRVNGIDARAQIDGAALRVYPETAGAGLDGDQQLQVDAALRSSAGKTLAAAVQKTVSFRAQLPAVRFAGKGSILPAAERLTLPIEAVGVSAVQLRVFEIDARNIGQYLQRNALDYAGSGYISDYAQRDVGRYRWQKTLQLPQVPASQWQRYELDVSDLVASHKGSLLRLELQILPQHSVYPCDTPPAGEGDEFSERENIDDRNYEGYEQPSAVPSHLQRYFDSAGYYDWSASRNPCSSRYYSPYREHARVAQMFFASSIGVLAKAGSDGKLHVVATQLQTAAPLTDAAVQVFNYQQQRIGEGRTDGDGLLTLTPEGVPFVVRVEKDGDVNYLKVPRNEALPTAQFNTGGSKPAQGLKGFFYGERDIWRPGDDIHLTFVLMDRHQTLPANYPLTLEFFDPRGGKAASITHTTPLNGFYTFTLNTPDDAPTGNWRAIVKIGDNYFDEVIKVENIAPNRLKIDLELPAEGLHPDQLPLTTTLKAQWLTGATASTLKADVQLRLAAGTTAFAGFDGYVFDDRARAFSAEPQTIFAGNLDQHGVAQISAAPSITAPPPGVLAAVFTQRVFEPGGQFSAQYRRVPLYPFANWAGLRLPQGNAEYYGALDKDADHTIDLISLDSRGQPVPNRELTLQLYALAWSWWWDEKREDYAQYISNNTRALKQTATLRTDAQGHAQWTLHGKPLDWGRYLARVCDNVATGVQQHCASHEFYLGWGYGDNASRDAATRMALSTDQAQYRVGDVASIRLPDGPDRRVLVSIENGSRVLKRYWQNVTNADSSFTLPISADMTPNVYVHVTQLQPHAGRDNDLPLRLYGIVPLLVDDPATQLAPQIDAPSTTRPQSELAFSVQEKDGRAMTYTVALVDEGLLGITDYHAPDPREVLYRREALGVLTWDLFDQVVGAYSAELARLLSIGGADSLKKRDSNRERRFPPIVRFLGAFELKAGETRQHRVELPPYMGAVRVMVVAGDGRAYGRAEHSLTVTQPLTLLGTLPRVLGPGEELALPVSVFVAKPDAGTPALSGEVQVSLVADDFFTVLKGNDRVRFDAPGEQLAQLRLKANDRLGMAKVTLLAQLGEERAQEVIHIPVRSANPPSTRTQTQLLQPGASWTPDLALHGMPGTNVTTLTVSRMPELKLEQRLDYLIHYPHGCLEQITSAALPQLYLPLLVQLDTARTLEIEHNIDAAIARLAQFQTSSGGFAYWPYQNEVDPWANNYAGHFLLEAKRAGYNVPAAVLGNWLNYQREQARSFSAQGYAADAYRLYTLALANGASAHSSDMGAMNRLRERLAQDRAGKLPLYLLALAYQQIGQRQVASELLLRADTATGDDRHDWSYGSPLRDRAILLLLEHMRDNRDGAWSQAEAIAGELASDNWYSTQSTAWALMSLAQAFGTRDGDSAFALRSGDDKAAWQSLASKKPVYRAEHIDYQAGKFTVRNDSTHPLYVALAHRGIAASGDEQPVSRGLAIDTRFTAIDGRPLAVHALRSGVDFIAEVTVTNTSDRELGNIALTQVVPSGWQIRNTRLEGATDSAGIDYQHIGDDRLVSYFALSGANGASSSSYWWRERRDLPNAITVRMLVNASFAGRFYLPAWQAAPMYDGAFEASTAGQWVDVE